MAEGKSPAIPAQTIQRLTVENVKRIDRVEITPMPVGLVRILGENGAGKSSILDAIAYALGGAKMCPDRVVRDGTDAASVVVETDALRICREWYPTGESRLSITPRAGGTDRKAPQALLDSITSRVAFDPVVFLNKQPKDQRQQLIEIAGIGDALQSIDDRAAVARSKLKAEQARAEAARSLANKAASEIPKGVQSVSLEQAMSDWQHANDAETEWQSRSATLAQAEGQLKTNRDRAQVAIDGAKKWADHIALLHKQLKAATEEFEAAEAEAKAKREWVEAEEKRLASERQALDSVKPSPETKARAKSALDIANQASQVQQRIELSERAEKDAADIEAGLPALREAVRVIEDEKKTALANATFPVPGLGFDDTGPTLHGVPFAQASSSERLTVSVHMAMHANPTLRVILIRDGSLLDDHSRARVESIAAERGYQVWMEEVRSSGEGGFIIRDGRVEALPHVEF